MDARICDRCGVVFSVQARVVRLLNFGRDVIEDPDLCGDCRDTLENALVHFLDGGLLIEEIEEDQKESV